MTDVDALLEWAETERGEEPIERFLARVAIHAVRTLDAVTEGMSPGFLRLPPNRPVAAPKPQHRAVDE